MNLSKLYKSAISGAFMLLGFASMTSCTDANDWDVDSSFDRLFHTTNLSVTPLEDRVGVEFKLMPNTAKYIVEISTDTLNNDIAENANGNSIIKELTSSPDTIYDLQGSTKYFIRMRGESLDGKKSNWKYLDKYSFKTKSEQIITDVIVTSSTADVHFAAGKQVDAAYIYKDNDSVKQDISAAEVEAGLVKLTGLKANSSYKVKLWNGNTVRGAYSFKTTEAFPEGYQVITLTEGADLNEILANAENDKVVIVFPQGMTYKTPVGEDGKNKTPAIPDNIKSIYFWGAAGAEKPTFYPVGIKFSGNSDKDVVRFYNLNIVNASSSDYYVMNIGGAININSLEMEKCNISNTRGVIRIQSIASECKIGKVTINDCVISKIGSYGVFNSKGQAKMSIPELNITNSTINGVEASAVVNVQNANMKINVDHCTIYNSTQASKSMFDVNKLTNVSLVMANSLIGPFNGADGSATIKGMSMKGQQSVVSTYYTNDQKWNGGYELGDAISGSSVEFWEDAAKGDFTIKSAFKSQYENCGDPRWIVAE